MAEPRARIIDGRKFMWDGREYESEEEAARVAAKYEEDRFETRIVEPEDQGFQVYTRRVVAEPEVEGSPPA